MTWYEKITDMSLDELSELLTNTDWDEFLVDGCELCSCSRDDGSCVSTDRMRDCAEAIKVKLRQRVSR